MQLHIKIHMVIQRDCIALLICITCRNIDPTIEDNAFFRSKCIIDRHILIGRILAHTHHIKHRRVALGILIHIAEIPGFIVDRVNIDLGQFFCSAVIPCGSLLVKIINGVNIRRIRLVRAVSPANEGLAIFRFNAGVIELLQNIVLLLDIFSNKEICAIIEIVLKAFRRIHNGIDAESRCFKSHCLSVRCRVHQAARVVFIREVHHLGAFRCFLGGVLVRQFDAHVNGSTIRGLVLDSGVALIHDLDVKQADIARAAFLHAQSFLGLGHVRGVVLRPVQQFPDLQVRVLGDARFRRFVGHSDVVGFAAFGDHGLLDLRVAHADFIYSSVGHAQGQDFRGGEGLQADQHPIPGR